jgi:hypothetical protein
MEQQLYVVTLTESMDMGVSNNSSQKKVYALSELTKGAALTIGESWGQPNPADADDTVHIVWNFTVDELTDDKLVFTFKGHHFTLNRHWQVLGTGYYGVPNAYIHISKRFIFYFGTQEKSETSQFNRLQELCNQMAANEGAGNFWKNIPLGREALYIMKDVAPAEDESVCMEFCELVVKEKLLSETDSPRLLLSFMDFWHALQGSAYNWNQETYRLLRMTDPDVSKDEKLRLIDEIRHLRYDPVQLTETWEENIYEVEKELDELFKGEPMHMGFCFRYWSAKEAALAKRSIEWRSPQIMNPHTRFD